MTGARQKNGHSATMLNPVGADLLNAAGGRGFKTVLADPPWQFQNRTGKVAPGASTPQSLRDDDARRDCALPVAESRRDGASLSLGAQRAAARGCG